MSETTSVPFEGVPSEPIYGPTLPAYQPTQDERTLACVSHLTVFVSTIGWFVAIGLWVYTRSKYPYAAFQAAQAVIFQFVMMLLSFFVIMVWFFVFAVVLGIGLLGGDPDDVVVFSFAVSAMMVMVGVILLLTLALYGYAIYAAVRSYQGRPFRIPGIAALADAFQPMPPVPEEDMS
jgi:uncharacterized Tic20 family protein